MRISFLILSMLFLSTSFTFAIKVDSLSPSKGGKDICIDSPLKITFGSAPTLGTSGKIEVFEAGTNKSISVVDISKPVANQSIGGIPNFNYYSIIVTGNTATIYLPNQSLSIGKEYYVKIDADAFKDYPGLAASDWTFHTKAKLPAVDSKSFAIDASGQGDFCTIQGAIDSIPDNNTSPITLNIKKGVYNEIVYFKNKHNITLKGEDRKESVIQYANNNVFNKTADGGAYHRGMFMADKCRDLTISNLTFHNITPRGGSQAEAIILKSSLDAQMKILDCDLVSFQDTLQVSGQCYIANCYIEGDVDFMWGSGPCYFENCHLSGTRSKAYYTQIRNSEKNHGFVYNHCTFDGPEGVERMVFGRIDPNTFPYSEVVILNSTIGSALSDWGWLLSKEGDSTKMRNWEYNNKTPKGDPVDTSKRAPHTKILKDGVDDELIKNYSDPVWVLGGKWNPKL